MKHEEEWHSARTNEAVEKELLHALLEARLAYESAPPSDRTSARSRYLEALRRFSRFALRKDMETG